MFPITRDKALGFELLRENPANDSETPFAVGRFNGRGFFSSCSLIMKSINASFILSLWVLLAGKDCLRHSKSSSESLSGLNSMPEYGSYGSFAWADFRESLKPLLLGAELMDMVTEDMSIE